MSLCDVTQLSRDVCNSLRDVSQLSRDVSQLSRDASNSSRDVTHFLHNVVITNFETNGLPYRSPQTPLTQSILWDPTFVFVLPPPNPLGGLGHKQQIVMYWILENVSTTLLPLAQ